MILMKTGMHYEPLPSISCASSPDQQTGLPDKHPPFARSQRRAASGRKRNVFSQAGRPENRTSLG
jgi:hypothetical protein